MFTYGEFGCDTKAVKHLAIRFSLSLWVYVHWMVWHTNRHEVNGWGEWGWVDGMCDGGGERGEKGAIIHVEYHQVSLSVRCMLVPNSKNL
jgi:hypothetical protein